MRRARGEAPGRGINMAKRRGKAKVPEFVWIGCVKYTVEFKSLVSDNMPDGEGVRGLIYYRDRRIELDEAMSGSALAKTFLHEILHGLWDESALSSIKEAREEDIVSSLASDVTAFWMDNPLAFRWWNGLIASEGKI